MKAAESFNSENPTLSQQAPHLTNGLDASAELRDLSELTCPNQRERRPAYRTSVGLGMKTTIGRIFVLMQALRAHGKTSHRGQRAIIGNFPSDGVARPAVRAIRKRVAITPVCRIAEIGQAIGASGDIR